LLIAIAAAFLASIYPALRAATPRIAAGLREE
jgi:ABC-type lipoprotein release transport system permease subunit